MTKYSTNLYAQAMFLSLVRNDTPLDKDTKYDSFNVISRMMKGYRNISSKMTAAEFASNSLLAYQLSKEKEMVVRSVNIILEKAEKTNNFWGPKLPFFNKKDTEWVCKKIAAESPPLFTDLVNYARSNDFIWVKSFDNIVQKTGLFHAAVKGNLSRFDGKEVSLLSILKRSDNPFAHENAILALLLAILDNYSYQKNFNQSSAVASAPSDLIDISNCTIKCEKWDEIQSLDVSFTIMVKEDQDPLFPVPTWVEPSHKSLYQLGMFLRSCLTGSIDWSTMSNLESSKAKYSGIKSSFLKRQLGMMHSPESLNGETAPMSNWISGLLSNLLQWPGVNIHANSYEWPADWNLQTLRKLLQDRILHQRNLYCKMIGAPAYVERLNFNWPIEKKSLRVVMVQSLLPLKSDFLEHGMMLDTLKYRARHRRHIASVAELILHKSHSQRSIDDANYKNSSIDLIVWPELAVNNHDIDILRQLANKTGAIIFTGLTFTKIPGIEGPNNVAKWIIPQKMASGRKFMERLQGKFNMMKDEVGRIKPWRPYQLLIEMVHPAFPKERGFTLTGSICFDSTDIKISADLKNKSDAYFVVALNQDVNTFDSMVDALYYHMYQHVVLVNTGEFGGSVAKAPYKERHEKLITHVHGAHQVSISSFDMNMFDFKEIGKSYRSGKSVKTKPAG